MRILYNEFHTKDFVQTVEIKESTHPNEANKTLIIHEHSKETEDQWTLLNELCFIKPSPNSTRCNVLGNHHETQTRLDIASLDPKILQIIVEFLQSF